MYNEFIDYYGIYSFAYIVILASLSYYGNEADVNKYTYIYNLAHPTERSFIYKASLLRSDGVTSSEVLSLLYL